MVVANHRREILWHQTQRIGCNSAVRAMEKLRTVVSISTKLSNHIRFRDRSVKVVQYGCQMLLGFYGSKMSDEVRTAIALTRRTASTSRKFFWLLRSVNHLDAFLTMIQKDDFCWRTSNALVWLDLIEQLCLMVYFAYENLVLLTRVKLVSFTEESIDPVGNLSWALGDVAGFIALVIRFLTLCNQHMKQQCGCASTELMKSGQSLIIVSVLKYHFST